MSETMSQLCGAHGTSPDGGLQLSCEELGEHCGLHRQVVDGHEYRWYPSDWPQCRGCGEHYDPETCWCGDERKNHVVYGSCPGFVPMGCRCGYIAAERAMKER